MFAMNKNSPCLILTALLLLSSYGANAVGQQQHQQQRNLPIVGPVAAGGSPPAKSSAWQGISASPAAINQTRTSVANNSNNNNNNAILNNEWIGNGHLQFTFDLLGGIFMNSLDMKTGNLDSVVFSPFSIQSMLMMIHLGAKGATKAEIAKVLHLDAFENNITFSKSHEAFGQAVKSLIEDANISRSLHSANQIFVQETFPVSSTYLSALNHYHMSSVKYLNFAKDSYQALTQINDWIEKQTKHLITNFLNTPPSPMTTLMVVNAIRFKGDWQFRFDPSDTEKDAWFRRINGQTTSVEMMVGQLPVAYGYSHSLKTSIIELPFRTQRLSFFILLPNDTFGLFSLLNSLNATVFANLIYSMRKVNNNGGGGDKSGPPTATGVNIRIPKFSTSSMPHLTDILKNKLGMKTIFSAENANLEAMFNRYPGRIHMGELLHKAVLKIDEQGGVGAAVSTSSIERIGAFNGPYFEADHPFIYLLMDKQTGLALFAGIYAGPDTNNKDPDPDASPPPPPSSSSSSIVALNPSSSVKASVKDFKFKNVAAPPHTTGTATTNHLNGPGSSSSIGGSSGSRSSSHQHQHHHHHHHYHYPFGVPVEAVTDNKKKFKI